jgi:hypothetical protein
MLYFSRVDIIEHGPFVDDVPINWVIFQRYVSLSEKNRQQMGNKNHLVMGFSWGM